MHGPLDEPFTDRTAGATAPATDALERLQARVARVAADVKASAVWAAVTGPESPRELAIAVLREIMWSVATYQPRTTEAGFAMIGRLPKREVKLLMSLTHHKAEEAEHGLWARRDFLLLGGREEALAAPPSPAVFAVIGVWTQLSLSEDPFGYLGAEYLFEALTADLTPRVMAALARHGHIDGTGFVAEHAVEDVKHTRLFDHWVVDAATRYPHAADSMIRAFDYFAEVYPLPVWTEALARARDSAR